MNIDRIAREMVDVEPSANLEARIRARVRETQPTRPGTPWVWRVAVPASAAAVVIIAFAIRGSQSPATPKLAAGVSPARVSVIASTGQLTAAQQPTTSQARAVNTSRIAKVPAPQLSAEELAWMERRMPALEPVNALEVDRLRVDSIQPEPLAITPLTMTPVATDGAGAGRNDR